MKDSAIDYWNVTAESYQSETRISIDDFHYGPLLPGEKSLRLFLPRCQPGMDALELGCGAGQNSIFLAKNGLNCVALDGASAQIDTARALARDSGAMVDFRVRDLDVFTGTSAGVANAFDVVHSVFTVPFLADGGAFVAAAGRCVKPGGTLILATAHPLFNGDWVQMENDETGVFVEDYFNPPADERRTATGIEVASRPVPISSLCEWLHAAGLVVERLLEPKPVPIKDLTDDEIAAATPYDSQGWRELHDILRRIPVAVVVVARRLL